MIEMNNLGCSVGSSNLLYHSQDESSLSLCLHGLDDDIDEERM